MNRNVRDLWQKESKDFRLRVFFIDIFCFIKQHRTFFKISIIAIINSKCEVKYDKHLL